MPLHPGTRLGPYEIVAPLGSGGMGEVWRARDPRLGRDVAIKCLPAAFVADPERVARFEREARTLAALLHPNIGAIFGLEESGGERFLVLEFVDGETLAARIARGPLPLEDSLETCEQVAAAIEVAHEAGIVHRDLKPGNVMVRPDGTVKVLDFGLARAGTSDSQDSTTLTNSPTRTSPATAAGVILGTAAYMSPEQARGRVVDRRTDIWSFGCLLYECLAGRPAFVGETVSDLIARILEREPDWNALPGTTPPAIVQLLHRCLTKDARTRLRDIGEARIALAAAREHPRISVTAASEPVHAVPRHRGVAGAWVAAVVVAALAAGALAGTWLGHRREAATRPVRRLSIVPPANDDDFATLGTYALSPDGRMLAFTFADSGEDRRVYVRDLADDRARPLPGTEGAEWPFWSPDSRDIGFFAREKLCRVPASVGAVRRICSAPSGRGASWGSRGTIVFAPEPSSGIWMVDADGGVPRQLTRPDSSRGEASHRWPAFLPDGRHFLFAVNGAVSAINGPIEIAATDDPARHRIGESATAATFAAPDRIVFTHDEALLSQRLDLRRLALLGKPDLLADQPSNTVTIQLAPRVSCSSNGLMAFTPKDVRPSDLVAFDPGGTPHPIARFPVPVFSLSLSRDGKRVASASSIGQGWSNYVLDLGSGTVNLVAPMGRGTFGPVWGPDDRTLIGGTMDGIRQIDVATGDVVATPAIGTQWSLLGGWTPDGRELLMARQMGSRGYDIVTVPMNPPGPARAWLATPANEDHCELSHDGALLAYVSDAQGTPALFVDTYPARTSPARGVTVAGTNILRKPVWSRDDRELFAIDTQYHVVAMTVTRGDRPALGAPRVVGTLSREAAGWNVTPDGRILYVQPHGDLLPSITLVDGWMREASASH